MRISTEASSNVVPFRRAKPFAPSKPDQKTLMDAVYTAGSLPVPAADEDTKVLASRLQVFGFVVIDEVRPDGSARRLRPSEAILAETHRPWRVSKPSVDWQRSIRVPAADLSLFDPVA
jgi:hypothetical protein